ncbi:MAG: hypothetical protein HYS27_02835 [Deltaproteobacteria bacterium]|nr:hypothetical protein [Deltaproteobacteria bacterium]
MIPVTRRAVASTTVLVLLCFASGAARAEEARAAPATSEVGASPLAVEEAVVAPYPAPETVLASMDMSVFAPLAGAVGATAGLGLGVVGGVGTAFGLLVVQSWMLDASASGWTLGVVSLAQLATPVLLVAMPLLGAALGAFAALALFGEAPLAALGGAAAAIATPIGVLVGAVACGTAGLLTGIAFASANGARWDNEVVALLGVGGAILGGGLGGVAGAATGGGLAGLAIVASE